MCMETIPIWKQDDRPKKGTHFITDPQELTALIGASVDPDKLIDALRRCEADMGCPTQYRKMVHEKYDKNKEMANKLRIDKAMLAKENA